MAEVVKRRQQVKLVLPAELASRLLDHRTQRDILQGQLDTVTGSGVDISSDTAVKYLQDLTDAVISASLLCNADMREVLALAVEKAGYDAKTCTAIQDNILEASGAVFWSGPVEGAA